MERITVDLSDVPETLLWSLGRRASAARMRGSVLDDPRAIEVADKLDYDFTDTSRGAGWHAVRVATFDAAVRRFLTQHPAGTVVALGEGLETQFWRLDNGRMQWVTVDLPETLKLRQQTAARWSQATQPRRICAGQRLAGQAGPRAAGAGHRARTAPVLPTRAGT